MNFKRLMAVSILSLIVIIAHGLVYHIMHLYFTTSITEASWWQALASCFVFQLVNRDMFQEMK